MRLIHTFGIALVMIACAARGEEQRPAIRGQIVSGKTQAPVSGASAFIYTAKPKTGASSFCPSCYVDCGKSAQTDLKGRFLIDSLSENLIFRILIVAQGYQPQFVDGVAAGAGTLTVGLLPQPTDIKPDRTINGIITDGSGRAVVGATVSVMAWQALACEPLAITDQAGRFGLIAERSLQGQSVGVQVESRGLASQCVQLSTSTLDSVKLGVGATVDGRAARDGRPLANVDVGLVQQDRASGFTGARTTRTDSQGHFLFYNVGPHGVWNAYVCMSSLSGKESVPYRSITVGGDDTTCQAGDLSTRPAYSLSGQVILADGKPVPAGTRILVAREDTWDTKEVVADQQGRFVADGLPPEHITLSLRIKSYHMSPTNKSLNFWNDFLEGRVDQNISDLKILMVPGARVMRPFSEADAQLISALPERRLQGAVVPSEVRHSTLSTADGHHS